MDDEEFDFGIRCIAVPTIDLRGRVVGGLSRRESFLPLHTAAGQIPRQTGITVAGISWIGKGYRMCRPNAHDHYVFFAVAGAGHLVTETESRDVRPRVVLIAPVHSTYIPSAPEAPWHAMWFHLENNQIRSSISRIGFCVRRSHAANVLLYITPSRMLCRLRMQRARDLLKHTDYKPAMEADMVGYSDVFAFSAAFKRICGSSPSRCRETD